MRLKLIEKKSRWMRNSSRILIHIVHCDKNSNQNCRQILHVESFYKSMYVTYWDTSLSNTDFTMKKKRASKGASWLASTWSRWWLRKKKVERKAISRDYVMMIGAFHLKRWLLTLSRSKHCGAPPPPLLPWPVPPRRQRWRQHKRNHSLVWCTILVHSTNSMLRTSGV